MTNSLIQELCRHIDRLEAENEKLQMTIDNHNKLFADIVNASGFDTLTSFLEWAIDNFKNHRIRPMREPTSIQKLSRQLFSQTDLPSIQQVRQQTSSRNSIITSEQFEYDQLTKTAQWGNQTTNLPRLQSTDSLNDTLSPLDCIVLQNNNLRTQIKNMRLELQKHKQSIDSLMFILKTNSAVSLSK